MDLSGKKTQNAEKRSSAVRKRLQLRAVAFCFSLMLCIQIFILLLLLLSAILALCKHHINVHIMCFGVREGTKKRFLATISLLPSWNVPKCY